MRGYKFMGAILVIATFFTMAGGAGAAKINDRQVKARHLATNSIHCRALDKYLKGHLCGPNATIKKIAGPPGPPGPAAGLTEVFYVARAVTPRQQIFSGDGLALHATCDSSVGPMTLEVTTTEANGTLRSSAVIGDDNVEYANENLGAGTVERFIFTEALLTMSYLHPNGSNLNGTFQVDSDTNGALNDTRDCVFAGHMLG